MNKKEITDNRQSEMLDFQIKGDKKNSGGLTLKALIALAIMLIIFGVPLIVNTLYKYDAPFEFMASEWTPGDCLAYISSAFSLLATGILGVLTYKLSLDSQKTNERLSEVNLYYQKISLQKMFPLIGVKNIKTENTIIISNSTLEIEQVPQKGLFQKYSFRSGSSPWEEGVLVNVDVDPNETEHCVYKKNISFEIYNCSEAVIRHIAIDDIEICGYDSDSKHLGHCKNVVNGGGLACLLSEQESVKITASIYFCSQSAAQFFDNFLGGMSIIFYVTNTTITGIGYKEFFQIRITNDGALKVQYGDRSYTEVNNNGQTENAHAE